MAELLLKINDGANYEDGDCLCAFSDRHIACVHSQMICSPKKAKRNASGLLEQGSLTWHWMRETYQYLFRRVSASEIVRIDRATNERERFGPEAIDVRLFIRRRKRQERHLLFGEDGREVWFGGRSDFSAPILQRIWNKIEQDTPHRRNDARRSLWPMGRLDIRSHLAVRTDAITEKQVADFTEPQYEVDDSGDFVWDLLEGEEVKESQSTASMETPPDERPGWRLAIAQKRRRKIVWRELLADIAETESKVRDPNEPIGHEIDEPEGRRYTSKSQINQRLTKINKKAARWRRARQR